MFLVTGGATGIGLELVQILYAHNAKVYIAARSEEKASKAIASIETSFPKSTGELHFLHLDLSDLVLVKKSAESFLSKETRLDVLWNNAGVMVPPQGSKTKQDYESQLGTNCLGPFLFTKLLTPLLVESAKSAPRGSVRVVWLSSSAAESLSPKGGIDMTKLDYKKDESAWYKYAVSKTGNIFYSKEFARRHKADGVVSVVCARHCLFAICQGLLVTLAVSKPWLFENGASAPHIWHPSCRHEFAPPHSYPWRVHRAFCWIISGDYT